MDGKGFEGIVDLVTMEAFFYTPGGDGHGKIGEIPASLKEPAQRAHETLVELVAEGKDELMEEYFREGTIPEQHLISALHEAIREDRIFPVLYASGLANVATDHLLDFLKVYAPAPIEREPVAARAALHAVAVSNGEAAVAASADQSPEIVMRKVADAEPLSLYVFKTMTDPFAGRISFFKVFSGVLKNDGTAPELLPPHRGKILPPLHHAGPHRGRRVLNCTPATSAPSPSSGKPSPATPSATRATKFSTSLSRFPNPP